MTLCFGRITVFSMVFAISILRHREKLIVFVEHKLGDVPLVTILTSIISTFGSGDVLTGLAIAFVAVDVASSFEEVSSSTFFTLFFTGSIF